MAEDALVRPEKGRAVLEREMLQAAARMMPGLGIELIDVRIRRLNYIESVQRQVESRMVSERQSIAERFRSEGQGRSQEILGDMERQLRSISSEAERQAAEIAERHGLSFGLYGAGWEKHPELGPHARGTIDYGRDLEALTQQTRINLQLEPFIPTQHQRLLDGLAAGGFFLSRWRHNVDPLLRRALPLLDGLGSEIATMQQARNVLGDGAFAELEQLQAAMAEADAYDGGDAATQARLELARDERVRELQRVDARYQIAKDLSDNLTISYNTSEVVMARLMQTNTAKQRVRQQAISFFGTNETVLTALTASFTGLHGLDEATQTRSRVRAPPKVKSTGARVKAMTASAPSVTTTAKTASRGTAEAPRACVKSWRWRRPRCGPVTDPPSARTP